MGICGEIPHLGTFFETALDEAIPLSFQWDITWRCDHKCVHCYITDRRQPELSFEECERVLDELAEAGVLMLLFSGGDLFLRPDAVRVLRAARSRDFAVKLNTHGNFVTDEVADALAEMGVGRVSLSVYSDTPEEHEAVTLIPGSHAKTLAAAERLIARGVDVNFKTPVMVHNRSSYHRVGAVAKRLGATWEVDPSIVSDDQSDFGLCDINTHPTERILGFMKVIEPRRDEVSSIDALEETPSAARTCSAGTTSGYISPDGTLFPCINWREAIGSLREASFQTLWRNDIVEKQRLIRRASFLQDCSGCTFHGKCGYCPGISHAQTGDATRRSTYVCERTHLSMAALEHVARLNETGAPVPDPGTEAALTVFAGKPSFAERQFAARKAGMAQPASGLRPRLVQIDDPRPTP